MCRLRDLVFLQRRQRCCHRLQRCRGNLDLVCYRHLHRRRKNCCSWKSSTCSLDRGTGRNVRRVNAKQDKVYLEVFGNGVFLILWNGKDIGETSSSGIGISVWCTSKIVGSRFWLRFCYGMASVNFGSTDIGNPRAGIWETLDHVSNVREAWRIEKSYPGLKILLSAPRH